MTNEIKNFAEFAIEVRKGTGLIKSEFARYIGKSDAFVHKTETGERPPTKETIKLYADLLYVHPVCIIYEITKRDVILCAEILKSITDKNYNHGEIEHKLHNIGRKLQEKLIKNNTNFKLFNK